MISFATVQEANAYAKETPVQLIVIEDNGVVVYELGEALPPRLVLPTVPVEE